MNNIDNQDFYYFVDNLDQDQAQFLKILSLAKVFNRNLVDEMTTYLIENYLFNSSIKEVGKHLFSKETEVLSRPEKKYVSSGEDEEMYILNEKLGTFLRNVATKREKGLFSRFIVSSLSQDLSGIVFEPALDNLLLAGQYISSLEENFSDQDKQMFITSCENMKSHKRAAKGGMWSIWLTRMARGMKLNIESSAEELTSSRKNTQEFSHNR